MTKKRWSQLVWLFNILLLLAGSTISRSQDARYAYFFDLDKYIKVEIDTQRIVARGSLYNYRDLKSLLPASLHEGGPPSIAQYDLHTRRLYLLTVQPETYRDLRYKGRILIVEWPDYKLVGRIDLGRSSAANVNTLLTPDGKRLLVSYDLSHDDKENFVFVREVYDTGSFKLLETKKAVVPRDQWTPEAGRNVYFSRNARFSEDGQTIYDEDTGDDLGLRFPRAFDGEEYVINGDHVAKRKKPDWPAPVKEFMAKNPNFSSVWSTSSPERVLLVDLKYRQVTETIQDPKSGEVRPTGRTYPGNSFTTGQVVYYDAMVGGRLKQFIVKELAGDKPRVLAITPDGRTAYFEKLNDQGQWEHYAIDLLSGKAVKLELFNSTHVRCIFADR